jgi:hypothetical protein
VGGHTGTGTVGAVSFKSIGLDEDLHAYLVAHSGRPDPLVAELVATTRARRGRTKIPVIME